MKKLRLIQTLILCLSFQICVGFGMVEHSCTVNDANKPITSQNSNKLVKLLWVMEVAASVRDELVPLVSVELDRI